MQSTTEYPLSKTATTRRMWEIAQANPQLLHYPGTGRLWYRPDGEPFGSAGLFIELRVERYTYRAQDTRLALIAYALIRGDDGQIRNVENHDGDYLATYMARSDYRPTFTRSQIEAAAGRMQSWGDHVAQALGKPSQTAALVSFMGAVDPHERIVAPTK